MRKLPLLTGLVTLPVIGASMISTAVAQPTPPPPPGPPMPTYQTRQQEPEGNRLATRRDEAQQFSYRCGSCHLAFGMGTNLIMAQRLALGETPDKGLLANRDDLTAEYVEAVVRNGKGAMPPLSRVDVTDVELKVIAAYLGKGK